MEEGEDDGIPLPTDGDIYEDYPQDQSGLDTTEARMEVINKIKAIGNEYFKNQDFENASAKYEKVRQGVLKNDTISTVVHRFSVI